MNLLDAIPSIVVPLAALAASFGAMTINAALNGGVVVDTIDAHQALADIARRSGGTQ